MQPRPRSPLLVVLWSYGLFVLAHTVLYLHFFIAMRLTGSSFGEVASGQVVSPPVLLSRGLIGALLGIPLVFVIVPYLWRRSREWEAAGMSDTRSCRTEAVLLQLDRHAQVGSHRKAATDRLEGHLHVRACRDEAHLDKVFLSLMLPGGRDPTGIESGVAGASW